MIRDQISQKSSSAEKGANAEVKIEFGALTTYSPRGETEIDRFSRECCYQIKVGRGEMIPDLVRILDYKRFTQFEPFFQKSTVLVPVPRSAPLKRGAFWPAERISEEMVSRRLAMGVEAVLRRSEQVPKSALADSTSRPDPRDHFRTLEASNLPSDLPLEITLVDDVFTRGSTFLGAAKSLRRSYPNAIIRAFALVWTSGRFDKLETLEVPVKGTLKIGRFGKPIRRKHRIKE